MVGIYYIDDNGASLTKHSLIHAPLHVSLPFEQQFIASGDELWREQQEDEYDMEFNDGWKDDDYYHDEDDCEWHPDDCGDEWNEDGGDGDCDCLSDYCPVQSAALFSQRELPLNWTHHTMSDVKVFPAPADPATPLPPPIQAKIVPSPMYDPSDEPYCTKVEVHTCIRNLRMLLTEQAFEIDMHVSLTWTEIFVDGNTCTARECTTGTTGSSCCSAFADLLDETTRLKPGKRKRLVMGSTLEGLVPLFDLKNAKQCEQETPTLFIERLPDTEMQDRKPTESGMRARMKAVIRLNGTFVNENSAANILHFPFDIHDLNVVLELWYVCARRPMHDYV